MSRGSSRIIASLVNAFGASVMFLVAFYLITWWWLQAKITYQTGMVSFAYETGSTKVLEDPTVSSHIISTDIGGLIFLNVVLLVTLTLPIGGCPASVANW